jgi:DNA-binding NarL/FixJ family response regulator
MPLLILVADDNLGTRISICDYLEMFGYSVVAAEDGLEALSLVETYHPHLIVTDISMPRMDGYELVRQVRQRPPLRLLPIIFLSERASTEERIRGYQLGCDFYLPKPFEMHELGAMVRNLLERSHTIESEWRNRIPVTESDNSSTTANAEPHTATNSSIDLTQRERQVLKLITTGLSNVEIGTELYLSPRTVEKYVSKLLRKTTTSNRAELVRFAIEHSLID